jgi:hypothetical protein
MVEEVFETREKDREKKGGARLRVEKQTSPYLAFPEI